MLGEILENAFGLPSPQDHSTDYPGSQAWGEAAGETYVACLACGKRLRDDLTKMRVGRSLDSTNSPSLSRC